ncbi:unnamed protein product [Blepharisma stoltei]|uniref:EF-hand domain-containing protein n=1 Tax=Blepharisma stoltei TaxID=1481888 RepID=A0AAU9JVX8_9CILI|nr:unnamed protein product [Blepharisma stoltei]
MYGSLIQSENETDPLLLINRSKLNKIFSRHIPGRDGKISPQEVIKFCKNVRIFPDLIQMIELKKMIRKLCSSNKFSYQNFETLFKLIADQAFNTNAPINDKLRMLFIHIRNSCKMHYQVSFTFDVKKENSRTPLSSEESMQDIPESELKSLNCSREIKNDKNSGIKYSTKFITGIKRFSSISPQRALSKSPNMSQIARSDTKESRGITISPAPFLDISEKSSPCNISRTPLATTFSSAIIPCDKSVIKSIKLDKSAIAMPKSNSYLKIRAHLRALSSGIVENPIIRNDSPETKKQVFSIEKAKEVLGSFKEKHKSILLSQPKIKQAITLKQSSYIERIRNQYFSPLFVKTAIFNAWKSLRKNHQPQILLDKSS